MKQSVRRSTKLSALVAAAITTAALAVTPLTGAAESTDSTMARASGFGSHITGNMVLGSGRTGYSTLCTNRFSRTADNNVAQTEANAKALADIRGVASDQTADVVDGKKTVTSVTRVAGGSLLEGVVTFEGLVSRSKVTKTKSGYVTKQGADLVQLVVDGENVPVDGMLPVNQEIPLGIGTLTINRQVSATSATSGRATTEVLRLVLVDGTTIRVGRSSALLTDDQVGIFRGGAWATEAMVANTVSSGKTGFVPMPCTGSDGEPYGNNTAGGEVEGAVTSGTTANYIQTSKIGSSNVWAEAVANVQNVAIGGTQITIDAIRSKIKVTRNADGSITKTPFTRVLGFEIGGTPQTLPVDGQAFEIPGVLKIETNVIKETARGAKVIGVVITLLDAGGEPIVVNLANAAAYIRK
jgi:hypothetical protein